MILLVAAAPGCRCFRYDKEGAVAPEVAECRHFSHLSMAALDRGDADQAERLGAQAVQSCPHDVQARRALADAMWRRGKATSAIEQIDQARRLSPDDPTLLVLQGEMYLSLDQWEAARAVATEALDADPNSSRAWILRGDTYRHAHRFDEALADYTRAVAIAPGESEILRRLAVVSLQRQQPQRALAYAQAFVDSFNPGETPPDAHDLQAQVYAELGRWDDAAESYALAASHLATPDRLFHLAEAEVLSGRRAAAELTLDRVLSSNPAHAQSLALRERLRQPESSDFLRR